MKCVGSLDSPQPRPWVAWHSPIRNPQNHVFKRKINVPTSLPTVLGPASRESRKRCPRRPLDG